MNKKIIAVIAEIVPVISVIAAFSLILSPFDSAQVKDGISITMLLGFLGFVFFFIGCKLAKGDRIVQVLGILDWLATLCVIGLYIVAILGFGL